MGHSKEEQQYLLLILEKGQKIIESIELNNQEETLNLIMELNRSINIGNYQVQFPCELIHILISLLSVNSEFEIEISSLLARISNYCKNFHELLQDDDFDSLISYFLGTNNNFVFQQYLTIINNIMINNSSTNDAFHQCFMHVIKKFPSLETKNVSTLFIHNYIVGMDSIPDVETILSDIFQISKDLFDESLISIISLYSKLLKENAELIQYFIDLGIIQNVLLNFSKYSIEIQLYILSFLCICMISEISIGKEDVFVPEMTKIIDYLFNYSQQIQPEALDCIEVMCSLSYDYSVQFIENNLEKLMNLPVTQIMFDKLCRIIIRISSYENLIPKLVELEVIKFILDNIEILEQTDILMSILDIFYIVSQNCLASNQTNILEHFTNIESIAEWIDSFADYDTSSKYELILQTVQ